MLKKLKNLRWDIRIKLDDDKILLDFYSETNININDSCLECNVKGIETCLENIRNFLENKILYENKNTYEERYNGKKTIRKKEHATRIS